MPFPQSGQWLDSDGDGFGDNPMDANADKFPNDETQWSDVDGDGYGDNPTGNMSDAFPLDPTQWLDTDGDGYGDNPSRTCQMHSRRTPHSGLIKMAMDWETIKMD